MERVRFAPSPTGPLHIGGLRTALFNYLYAKRNGGVFILRIEDTDKKRKVEGSENYIHQSLTWCNIEPDEDPIKGGKYGPYRQSERGEIYQKFIKMLIEQNGAYYAFDTTEELEEARKKEELKTGGFKYNAENRKHFKNSLTLSKEDTKRYINEGNYVVRLKVKANEEIIAHDMIRGTLRVNSAELEDKILVKRDGMPTYHFANVVDDFLMKITTVIRGEEWLPSLPIHKVIYDSFGWDSPKFMHLPLILNPSGKGKLSKRDGEKNGFPVFPLDWKNSAGYKERGFLPMALTNYIAQLGWNLDNQEIMSLKEMENRFNVNGLQKAGARFNYDKACWINQQYIMMEDTKTLVKQYPFFFEQLNTKYPEKIVAIIEMIKKRTKLLSDIEKETDFFLKDPEGYDSKSIKRIKKFDTKKIYEGLKSIISNNEKGELKEAIGKYAEENKLSIGGMMQFLRLAIVGRLSGPDLVDVLKILGKNVTLKRLDRLIINLNL